MRRLRFAYLAVALIGACATAGNAPGTADADPNAPDADRTRPDADPNAPDADQSMPPPDAMVSPPDAMVAAACTLVAPQTGCMTGQACDLDDTMLSTGGTECRAVTVAGTETSTCAGETACAAGYTCLGGVGTSQCFKYCSTDSHCNPTSGGLCTINIVYGTPAMEVPGVAVCSKACDPLNSTGCPSTFGCHVYQEPVGTAERFFTHCAPAGPGGQEAACTDDTGCQANYSCVNVGTATKCLKNCNVSTGTGCAGLPSGNSCVGYTDAAVVGGFEYGVCFDGT